MTTSLPTLERRARITISDARDFDPVLDALNRSRITYAKYVELLNRFVAGERSFHPADLGGSLTEQIEWDVRAHPGETAERIADELVADLATVRPLLSRLKRRGLVHQRANGHRHVGAAGWYPGAKR